MLISVIIPSYNEEQVIASTLEKIVVFFSKRPEFSLEIIVVDDCSKDRTGEIVRDFMRMHHIVKYARNFSNCGKGFSVKRGMSLAGGDFILFLDADFSTPIGQFDSLWPVAKIHDIVIASRMLSDSVILRHQTRLKEAFACFGNWLMRLLLRLPFEDTQCGFKIFSKRIGGEIFKYQTINRWGFDMEILFIARKWGVKIAQAPVIWSNDASSLVTKFDYIVAGLDIFKILINNFLGKYERIK